MLFKKKQRGLTPLFEAVGCACYHNNNVLLLKRNEDKSFPNHWGIPSGKIDNKETPDAAIIRELFEETSILLSLDNIEFVRKYHVVTSEFNFIYHLYVTSFSERPKITISELEHNKYEWFSNENIAQEKLIPDLLECLNDAKRYIFTTPKQLSLFPNETTRFKSKYTARLEDNIDSEYFSQSFPDTSSTKKKYSVSFGPHASGKTTTLRQVSNNIPEITLVEDSTIIKKRSSRLNYYLRKIWEDGDKSFFFFFQMEVLVLRFWYTVNAPYNSLVDETIYSTLAYTRALHTLKWITDYEYETFYAHYKFYCKHICKPENILFFKCDKNTLRKRIQRRGRKIEKLYPDEYTDALYHSFNQLAHEISAEMNVIEIETGFHNTEELAQYICSNI